MHQKSASAAIATTAFIGVAFAALAACTPPAPVISDISDSAIKIQSYSDNSTGDVTRKANEGCSIYKKTATAISYSCLDNYCMQKEYLFACKES